MPIEIRPFRPDDLEEIKRITVDSFAGVSLEHDVERSLGVLNGHDWRWRKARHVDEDARSYPEGIFIAEEDERILGYISTRVDRDAGKGRIPNIAIVNEARGKGLGRLLIDHALGFFRAQGLEYAMIETMVQNAIGNHLYPSCGFVEVARQVHFAADLRKPASGGSAPTS